MVKRRRVPTKGADEAPKEEDPLQWSRGQRKRRVRKEALSREEGGVAFAM